MKYIVKFKEIKPQGNVTINAQDSNLQFMELEELLQELLPYTRLFENIFIKNFKTIPSTLLTRLTNQYLHGAKIHVQIQDFNKEYQLNSNIIPAFYSYSWQPLDLSAPIPKSLAEFTFQYNGKKTTYLEAIKTLTSTKYLPNEIWTALDIYSRQQIDKCRERNQGEYSFAELWYKELMKDCIKQGLKVFSPNKKTYYEATAEIDFEKDCIDSRLQQGIRPLTEKELRFLKKYAPIYGIEVPTFKWKINSRKTDHGYTQEPERVMCGMSNVDWSRVIFDSRNDNNLPKFVRQGLTIRECENDKLLREAYFQLKWIMKHMKDNALMPGWSRCPHCHKLYRESEGCECGYCERIDFVNADNLFYSDSSTYEDYENTKGAYEDYLG